MHRLLLGVFVLACACPGQTSRGAGPPLQAIVPDELLVLPPVGNYGRNPLPLDFLQAEIVAGRWKAPRAGDRVALPNGQFRAWEKVNAPDGKLTHPNLRGGYALWQVHVPADCVLILDAGGCLTVRINGEPRTGDLYDLGIVRLPVALRAGVNQLLFHCVRGRLHPRLAPARPIAIEKRDATLPDLLEGEQEPTWAAVILSNATDRPASNLTLVATLTGGASLHTPVGPLPPLSTRKVAFRVPPTTRKAGETASLKIQVQDGMGERKRTLDSVALTLDVRAANDLHKRTFVSDIDGSVQYYSLRPARPAAGNRSVPGLTLTLHGAAVDATRQAQCYAAKTWTHVVAPTNRRPFGFDWEDWGRLDALEVLEHACKRLNPDPQRIYLTGHSMGGHGVWHLGATFPDRWAAIAPSAGWVSFASYGGGRRPQTPAERFLHRPAAPSNTLTLLRNYARLGVYVLHGEADDNVPVSEARFMRKQLGDFHSDFTYYERPGAGHWWGDRCMDWPPLFDFLQARTLPKSQDVRQVDFVTASPGVSAWCHWAGVEAQGKTMEPSEVHLRYQPAGRRITGTTVNVARLAIDLARLAPDKPVAIELDEQKLGPAPLPGMTKRLWLQREKGKWSFAAQPPASLKGPHRYGPFKEVFRNRMIFVYGTSGSAAENAWAFARARFDAETFWYRGNGSIDVVSDAQFDPAAAPDRNVVLYGHADGNAAWKALLGQSPVQVRRGEVIVGEKKVKGDLACLFVRPRPGSGRALVGVVAGSGPAGQRLTETLSYFTSGVGYPDCIVLAPEVLTHGPAGVRAAGFFGVDWGVASGEFLWAK